MGIDVTAIACSGQIRGVKGWNGPYAALNALARQIGGNADKGALIAAGWPADTASELAEQLAAGKGNEGVLVTLGLTEQLARNICAAIGSKADGNMGES